MVLESLNRKTIVIEAEEIITLQKILLPSKDRDGISNDGSRFAIDFHNTHMNARFDIRDLTNYNIGNLQMDGLYLSRKYHKPETGVNLEIAGIRHTKYYHVYHTPHKQVGRKHPVLPTSSDIASRLDST